MTDLYPIPWQPTYYLTHDTLTMLQLASAHAGHNIIVDDAWRSYASQKYLYDGYIAGLPGFNTASNPDTGQRNHMRGAAVDIVNRADRDAMLTVGFTPDGSEWWHFNNPRWQSMPIIPTNDGTTTASVGATPITAAPAEEDDDMKYELGSDTSGGIYVLGPQGISAVPNASIQLPLFQRLVKGDRQFTSAEWKAIDETLNRRL